MNHPIAEIAYREAKLIEFRTAAIRVKAARTKAELEQALKEADAAFDELKRMAR